MGRYVPSIGMEVHAELLTNSKMFCGCPVAFAGEPNTRCCPVCLGLPGALPVMNKKAVEHVIRTAMALNCEIPPVSIWHRKNYFYPDLPKGYQISQYGDTPIGIRGWLEIPSGEGMKRISIRRCHLEEDTGKLMHLRPGESEVDYNRSSVPLMEIVTDFPPDIESAEEAKEYLVQLRAILMYLGVSDGKMEEGSLRCEPNISVRPSGQEQYGTKTEIKNLGSFRAVTRGIQFEIERMSSALLAGHRIVQETRGWNEDAQRTFPMRTKETEQDYRYFPEPDLVNVRFDEEWLAELRATLPELPLQKRQRYMTELGLNDYDANLLTVERSTAEFFEAAIEKGADAKQAANWINGDFAKLLNESGGKIGSCAITPAHLANLLELLGRGVINGKQAKEIFADAFRSGQQPSRIVEASGLSQITNEDAVRAIIRQVMDENADVVTRLKGGDLKPKGFLVGQAMKQSKGRANPQLVQRLLDEELAR